MKNVSITFKDRPKKVTRFKDVQCGVFFLINGILYLKIYIPNSKHNAVNVHEIRTSWAITVKPECIIAPVKVKMEVTYNN